MVFLSQNLLAGPIQHFRAAILDGWRDCVSADLCGRKGVRGGPHLHWHASMQLLTSTRVRDRDEGLLRGILIRWGMEWCHVPCRICVGFDGDGHLFFLEIARTLHLHMFGKSPEFAETVRCAKPRWPRCLRWQG